MDSQKFIDLCKKHVVDFANSQLDYTDQKKNKRVWYLRGLVGENPAK